MNFEELEKLGGWRKGTEWQERWLDRCQWYFARCQYNDWDDFTEDEDNEL